MAVVVGVGVVVVVVVVGVGVGVGVGDVGPALLLADRGVCVANKRGSNAAVVDVLNLL